MKDQRTRAEKIAAVVKAAKVEVDGKYKEGPNNDTKFGKWYGLNYNPWCAMYVSWCFNEAGLVHLVAASSKKGFASCTYGMKWFAKKGQLIPIGKAQPGDIVFFNFDNDDTDAEHVGIVIKNDGKYLHTAEGNTVDPKKKGNQANGDGAYYKKRPYSYCMAVARPDWDEAGQKPETKATKPKPHTPEAAAAASGKKPEAPAKKPVAKKAVAKPKITSVKVAKGDTLWAISQKHGTTVAALKKANKLKSDVIKIGQVLKLPK